MYTKIDLYELWQMGTVLESAYADIWADELWNDVDQVEDLVNPIKAKLKDYGW